MNYRTIGNSDLLVSEIGLGCMSLGTEKNKARAIIDRSLDLGINYLDTADLYDFGVNEEVVGSAIKHRRSEVIVATKVGNKFDHDKEGWSWDPSKAYIKKAVKDSLFRLGTDYIDLYQLHGGTIEDPIDETIEAFEELKKEGMIRYYGISSIRPNVIREYVKKSSIISVMMQYSILDQRPEEEIINLLSENSVSVIARGPLAKGLLTDKWREKISTNGYLHLSNQELTQSIEALQKSLGERHLQEYALRYCLYQQAVAAVIPGASSIEQVEDNVKSAMSAPLTDEEVNGIKEIIRADQYQQHR
ncbi:aldo/keto reductase [Bacillus suaedaesalsae]|uniref:Aldo/keto reductase n=1 Tax=Bacillus suaedaesalsae TaxID=2810349 RepID=A0ABS2DNE0_9BACI|nr:aldo/keto reductase [Bacillus suaedaesalsae]MBM6619966.1 aldo/keto reductase [Bacillus suaedaesalsae]